MRIKSNVIKEKIKGLKLNEKNNRYVKDLIDIEKIILGKYTAWTTGYRIKELTEEYPKEYEIIYRELKPKEFEKVKKFEKFKIS
jgi:hypothetical protein